MTIHNGSLPSLANSDKDSLLQSATLLLADEFFQLDEHSRKEIASVKLYLTDKELLVANFKAADSHNQRAKVSYLRTHLLSDIDVEIDSEDASSMRIKETNGRRRRFLYRLRQGAAGLALWMSRICKNKCSCVAAARSNESFTSTEERADEAQPRSDAHQDTAAAEEVELPRGEKSTANNGLLPPVFSEWHGPLESAIPTSKSSPLSASTGVEGMTKRVLSCEVSDAVSLMEILQERRRSLNVQTEEPPTQVEEESESSPEPGSVIPASKSSPLQPTAVEGMAKPVLSRKVSENILQGRRRSLSVSTEEAPALVQEKSEHVEMFHEWHGESASKASQSFPERETAIPASKSSPSPTHVVGDMIQHHVLRRKVFDALDLEAVLQQRRRSLSAPTEGSPAESAKKNSAPSDSKHLSTPPTTRKRFKFPHSFARLLSSSASSTPRRSSSLHLRRKRSRRNKGTTSVPQTPLQALRPKSPGSFFKKFRTRFNANGFKVSSNPADSPSSTPDPIGAAMDEIDCAPLVPEKLYLQNAREVAEELTLIDAELLAKIDRKELENGAWMKKVSKHETSPNVMRMINSFSKLAMRVATEIVWEKAPQTRVKVISSYIQIASKLYQLHNYNSLNAILAGLQSASVFRLEKTWKCVPARRMRKFKFLTDLMSAENGWSNYRADLEKHQYSRVHCIPFFGQFLTALSQEKSFDDLDARQLQLTRAWGQSPPQSDSCSIKIPNQASRTSVSLPDIVSSVEAAATSITEPLHSLQVLPLTASQSENNIRNLSESSSADSHQPTQTALTSLSHLPHQNSKQRTDSAAWESLQSSQTSVDKNKQQQGLLNDSTLADSAIAVDCSSSSKRSPSITFSNELQVDESPLDTTEYELPLLEAAFENWDDTVFNGSFLSSSGGAPSTSSLEAVHPEDMDDSDSDEYSETEEDDDTVDYIIQEASYDSLHSEVSGILFAHPQQERDTPPPWPITLSVGDQPGCSGWQLITERDPNLTFDEQVAQANEECIRRVQEYWNQQALRPPPTPPSTRRSCSDLKERPSFIMNAPPGLPKGKGSSRPRKAKGQAQAYNPTAVDMNTSPSMSLPPYRPPQFGDHSANYLQTHSAEVSAPTTLPLKEEGQVHTPDKQTGKEVVLQMEATTPNLILLEKYKFFSHKYKTTLRERSTLRRMIEVARVLTEEKQFLMSCQHEPAAVSKA